MFVSEDVGAPDKTTSAEAKIVPCISCSECNTTIAQVHCLREIHRPVSVYQSTMVDFFFLLPGNISVAFFSRCLVPLRAKQPRLRRQQVKCKTAAPAAAAAAAAK
jgi:hypothetical protein